MRAVGFYPYQRFYINQKYGHSGLGKAELAKLLRQIDYSHRCDEWEILVSKDSLIQYCRSDLERDRLVIEKSWQGDLALALDYEPLWTSYLKDLNLIYFLLDCSIHLNSNIFAFEYSELKYRDIVNVAYNDNREAIKQATYGGTDMFTLLRRGHYKPKDKEGLPQFEMPSSVLDDLCSYYLSPILGSEEKKTILSSLAKSLSEHNLRNYNSSLVISWFIIESHLNMRWNDFLDEKKISGQRKKQLKGIDYTASIKTEMLETHGYINTEEITCFNKIRRKRNKIAHEFGKINADKSDSALALTTAQKIVEGIVSLKLPFSTTGFPIHGI